MRRFTTYPGLHQLTRDYSNLPETTATYPGLQQLTRDYSNLPGTTATVLRARKTLNVLKAARFPSSTNIVIYLQQDEHKRLLKRMTLTRTVAVINPRKMHPRNDRELTISNCDICCGYATILCDVMSNIVSTTQLGCSNYTRHSCSEKDFVKEVNIVVVKRASRCQGEASRSQGEASRSQGEASRSQGEASRSQGEASRSQGKASRSQGEASRSQGEASRSQGNASRNQGEASRSQGEASRSQGEASRNQEHKRWDNREGAAAVTYIDELSQTNDRLVSHPSS